MKKFIDCYIRYIRSFAILCAIASSIYLFYGDFHGECGTELKYYTCGILFSSIGIIICCFFPKPRKIEKYERR